MTASDIPPLAPAGARLKLARRLREYRQSRRYDQSFVAGALRWDRTKLSRIETGRVAASTNDVTALLGAYGVDDASVREECLAWARFGREPSRWAGLKPPNRFFVELEEAVSNLWIWQPLLVPGLLQTRDYAEATIEASDQYLRPGKVAEQVQLRMMRQERVITGSLQLHIVIDESVLLRPVGGDDTMPVQLEYLVQASLRTNVLLQVRPFVSPVPVDRGPFTILRTDFDDVIFAEGIGGDVTLGLDDAEQVTELNYWFQRMADSALPPDESRDLIEARINALGTTMAH